MIFSWRPIVVSLLTIGVAAVLACGLSALMALTTSDGFGYVFLKQLPAFLAGMLVAGIWCGCLLSYGMGVLAGQRQASESDATASNPKGHAELGAAVDRRGM